MHRPPTHKRTNDSLGVGKKEGKEEEDKNEEEEKKEANVSAGR